MFDNIHEFFVNYFISGRCSACSHYTKVKLCTFYAMGDYNSAKSYICKDCIDKVKKTIFKDQ